MKQNNKNFFFVLKWELLQLLFCFFFLLLFYLQEMAISRYLGQKVPQVRSIHLFLNSLQVPLLPDYFYLLFVPLMLLAIALIIFKKSRWFFLSLTGVFISILFIADRIYFSFFSSFITTESFSAAGQVWNVKSAIIESVTVLDIFFIIVFGLFFFFGLLLNKKIELGLPEGKIAFTTDKLMGVFFCLLAIYAYNIAFYIPKRYVTIGADQVMRVSKTKIDYEGSITYVPNYEASNKHYAASFGLMNFHIKNITDASKSSFLSGRSKDQSLPKGLYSFFDQKKQINEINSPFHGIAKGRNVFLIHFESLNPIFINAEIDETPITPTLNLLEKDSLYWDYVLDQVTVGGSSDAEFSSLTGMLPGTEKISAFNTSCMPHIPSMPRELRSMGYQTISMHGYEISFWNRNISQPLLGFESMYFKKSFQYDKKIGMGISDKDFFSQSIDHLKNHQPPFFTFLMTLTSHYPYKEIPEDYQHLFRGQIEPDSLLLRYLQAVRYTDDALGNFFAKIKEEGLWENSIFVIYGDHRPGTDNQMNTDIVNATGKSLARPRYSCVPVMIVIPGHENLIKTNKHQFNRTVGGLCDIFPTVMHLIGKECPFGVFGSHFFVQNEKRDPVPFFRFMDGFVFKGIQYRQQGLKISEDEMGMVFVDNADAVIDSENERLRYYKKALLSVDYCNFIYRNCIKITNLTPGSDSKHENLNTEIE